MGMGPAMGRALARLRAAGIRPRPVGLRAGLRPGPRAGLRARRPAGLRAGQERAGEERAGEGGR